MFKKIVGMILIALLLILCLFLIVDSLNSVLMWRPKEPTKVFLFRASGQDRIIEKQFDLLQTTTENTYTLRNADSTLIAIYRLTPSYSIEVIPLKKTR